MARGGITQTQVEQARQALLARGEHPGVDAIRAELGHTGSKTTIHRHLKVLDAQATANQPPAPAFSDELAQLVGQLAERLQAEAQDSVALQRSELDAERLGYEARQREAQERIDHLEAQVADQAARLETLQRSLEEARQRQQDSDVQTARLNQLTQDLQTRLEERDERIRSLEDKHRHARDALEHYRQASREQREQDQRRHEAQLQALQLETRQLQQSLMIRQDEITRLHRDNAALLAERERQQADLQAQQVRLGRQDASLEKLQRQLQVVAQARDTWKQRHAALQEQIRQLKKSVGRALQRREPVSAALD